MSSKKVTKGDLTELKSLANPPEAVKQIMTCTLLILGHPASSAKEWMYAKKCLATSTFLNDLLTYDPKQCKPENLSMAKGILDSCSREEVMKKSMAAASLHVWSTENLYAAGVTS